MGSLAKFQCPKCGFSTLAPVNTTGRYAIMMGTIQIFQDINKKELFTKIISRRYFDEEEHRDPVAEMLAKNFAKFGSTLEDIPLGNQPGNQSYFQLEDKMQPARRFVRPWNAITCGCPCCHNKMDLIVQGHILVD